jgi:ribulose 1,5-bisphosphate synthetase/thiazole synthase
MGEKVNDKKEVSVAVTGAGSGGIMAAIKLA